MLCSHLSLPIVTRARNFHTSEGRAETIAQKPVQRYFFRELYTIVRKLSYKVEDLKVLGFHPNEASRMNSYLQALIRELEVLHNIKEYRTPQATRSCGRIFIHLMPWLYGPYFVWVTKTVSTGTEQHQDFVGGFIFSLIYSVFTSIAMVGLFNVQRAMQDPFISSGFDNIHIETMCHEVHNAIKITAHNGSTPLVLDSPRHRFKGSQLHHDLKHMCVP